MNALYKVLVWVALIAGIAGWFFPTAKSLLSGTTNYDTIELRPVRSADNAIRVLNYASGTEMLNVDSSGNVNTSGTITIANTLSNTAATSTLGCLRVYQQGATTVASTTYYLVASTTAGAGGSFPVVVTSTKPTYCN